MKSASSARTLATLGSVLFALFSSLAAAQPRDEYGEIHQTVARISFLSGEVSFARGDDPEDWQPADRNVPMTLGDRIYTGSRSRIELQIHGGAFVRLGALTDFAALNLTDDTKQFSLKSGVASIRIRRLSDSEIFEIDTPNAAVSFDRPGEYRVDVDQSGFTSVAVRSGSATVAAGGGQVPLNAGEGMQVEGLDAPRYDIVELARADDWDQWVGQRDERQTRTKSYQYVSADIVGGDDLDEHGRWEQVRDYGWVWSPTSVASDWAPYRSGHWIWQDPWGWTWVSTEPWGWAPYHYGRWANISSRWCWVPVAPAVRYVSYSPALVAFVGGGAGWSATVSVGGGGFVGWFPLGPRDPFSPWWGDRARVGYSSNPTNVTYVNRTYITVVNRNTFVSGGVVTGNIVRDRTVVNQIAAAQVLRGPIPVVPTRGSLHVAVRGDAAAAPRPPAAVVSRMVVARTAPPPAPPTFQAKLAVISENRGAPVAPAAAARISVENRGRPQAVSDVRPVSAEQGRVTFSPRGDAGSKGAPARRVEPVTAFRGRPMATTDQPVSGKPAAPAAPPGPPDRKPVVREPLPPVDAAPQAQPDRGRERSVVTPPSQQPGTQPVERGKPQTEDFRRARPTEVPQSSAPPPPNVERRQQPTAAPPQPVLERRREQPTAAPPPPQPNFERRREQPTAAPAPPQPNVERRREQPTAAPPPPQPPPNVERRRERPTPVPEPPQTREAKPEGRRDVAPPPPPPAQPQGEARQPVQRGRPAPTPKPEDQKDKDKDKEKDKKNERERKPD